MIYKSIKGYEKPFTDNFCTVLSGNYLLSRLHEIRSLDNSYKKELEELFKLFEANIDKEKKMKLISSFKFD